MASVPFAVLCWASGAARGSEIAFFYLNLVSFILMAASFGLVHSLNPPAPGATRPKGGSGGAVFVVLFVIVPQVLFQSSRALNLPVVGEALQLLTPIGSFMAFWEGNAWLAQVTLWGVKIPSLVAAPVAQLAVAAWTVAAMARRLKNPLDPALTKPRAYATALVLDLLLAAIAYAKCREGASPTAVVFGFCFGHLIICLVIIFALTPRHAAVLSWIWRRDPPRWPLRDLLLADRSDVSLAALVLGLLGPAVMAVAFLAPLHLLGWPPGEAWEPALVAEASAVTVVLVVANALLHQLFAAIPKRGGTLLFILALLALNILPPIAGALLDSAAVRVPRRVAQSVVSVSPAAYYSINMVQYAPQVRSAWLVALYLLIAAASYRLLRRWLRAQSIVVDRKLASMGLASHATGSASAPPA
jgi:hypothetical protein